MLFRSELIAARITDGNSNIFLGSEGGKVIRFNEANVRDTARGSMGVRGMRIDEGTRVVGMEVLGDQETLLTVTENGYGKRTSVEEYRTQTRGGKGVFSIKTSKRNGQMVALALVGDNDELMMVTDKGKLIRTAIDGINVISRNTQGVKLINLSPKETLIGIARLPEGAAGPQEEEDIDGEDVETTGLVPDGIETDEIDPEIETDEIETDEDQGDNPDQ